MPWIKTVSNDEAQGLLQRIYEAAAKRTGKVYNILRVQSLNPEVLRAGIALYQKAMFGKSPLTRGQREMLAVVVSVENECHY